MSGKIILQNRSSNAPIAIFHIERGTFVLGRSAQCDFVVNNASVSRRHAEIAALDGRVTVSDLGSSNGTFVDGKRIQQCQVNVGQSVRFGKVTFALASGEPKKHEVGSDESTEESSAGNESLDSRRPDLSTAQTRVFNQLLRGLDEKQIAKFLFLSPHTVHNHLRAIYRAFQVHSRVELLAKIYRKKNGDA